MRDCECPKLTWLSCVMVDMSETSAASPREGLSMSQASPQEPAASLSTSSTPPGIAPAAAPPAPPGMGMGMSSTSSVPVAAAAAPPPLTSSSSSVPLAAVPPPMAVTEAMAERARAYVVATALRFGAELGTGLVPDAVRREVLRVGSGAVHGALARYLAGQAPAPPAALRVPERVPPLPALRHVLTEGWAATRETLVNPEAALVLDDPTPEDIATYVAARILNVTPKHTQTRARKERTMSEAAATAAAYDEGEPFAEKTDAIGRMAAATGRMFDPRDGERIPEQYAGRNADMKARVGEDVASLGASEGVIDALARPPPSMHFAYENMPCSQELLDMLERNIARSDDPAARREPEPFLAVFRVENGKDLDYTESFRSAHRALRGLDEAAADTLREAAERAGAPSASEEDADAGELFLRVSVNQDSAMTPETAALPLSRYQTQVLLWTQGLETGRFLYRPPLAWTPQEVLQKRRSGQLFPPMLEVLGPRFRSLIRKGSEDGKSLNAVRDPIERRKYRTLSEVLLAVGRFVYGPGPDLEEGFGAKRMAAFYARFIKSPVNAARGALNAARYQRAMPEDMLTPQMRSDPGFRQEYEAMRAGRRQAVTVARGRPTPENPSGVMLSFRGLRDMADRTLEDPAAPAAHRRRHKIMQRAHRPGEERLKDRAFRGENFGQTMHQPDEDGECPPELEGPGVSTTVDGRGERVPVQRWRKSGAARRTGQPLRGGKYRSYTACARKWAQERTKPDDDKPDDDDKDEVDEVDEVDDAPLTVAQLNALDGFITSFLTKPCPRNATTSETQAQVFGQAILSVRQWRFPVAPASRLPYAPWDAHGDIDVLTFRQPVIEGMRPHRHAYDKYVRQKLLPRQAIHGHLADVLVALAMHRGVVMWDRDAPPTWVNDLLGDETVRSVTLEDDELVTCGGGDPDDDLGGAGDSLPAAAWQGRRTGGAQAAQALAVGLMVETGEDGWALAPAGLVRVRRTALSRVVEGSVLVPMPDESATPAATTKALAPHTLGRVILRQCGRPVMSILGRTRSKARGAHFLAAQTVRELDVYCASRLLGFPIPWMALLVATQAFGTTATSWIIRPRATAEGVTAAMNQVAWFQPLTPTGVGSANRILPSTAAAVHKWSPFHLTEAAKERVTEAVGPGRVLLFRPAVTPQEATAKVAQIFVA